MYTVWYINERGQAMQRNMSETELRRAQNQRLINQGRLGIITDQSDAARRISNNNRQIRRDTYRW